VKIKKNLKILIGILFPIVLGLGIYLIFFVKKETKIDAADVTDSFNDTTYVDVGNSSNYLVEGGQLKVSDAGYSFGTGDDGACTVSSDLNINTGSCVGRGNGDAVNFTVTSNVTAGSNTVTLSSTPTGLAVDDEILIINLQGTSTNYSDVGEYETAYITQINSNTLTLNSNLTNGYDGTTQKIMVQRIPQYTSVTVNSGQNLYPSSWDGSKGGVLMFKANGTVTVNGTIHANAVGYRGGNATSWDGGTAGETYGGYGGGKGGEYNVDGSNGVISGGGGGGAHHGLEDGGAGGLGTDVGGSGGGGGCGVGQYGYLTKGGAGGGGGYGSGGLMGTGGWGDPNDADDGTDTTSGKGGMRQRTSSGRGYGGGGGGGGGYGVADLTKLYFGSGGGAGGAASGYAGGNGGVGGGIVYLGAQEITVNTGGYIKSNGGNGLNSASYGGWNCGTDRSAGGGGGSAGGSVYLLAEELTIGTAYVTGSGGAGGLGNCDNGGAGGNGRIRVEYITSLSGTTTPTASTNQLPAYADTMVLQSTDLISEIYNVEIKTFTYNLSAKPANTTATVQFSINATDWYNAAGVLGESDTLTTGVDNSIDLSNLAWESQDFYYKTTFGTNSGEATPVLDDITLGYDATPPAPTIGDPTTLSTTSIRWNFTDNASNETGFKLFDGSDVLVSTVEQENLSYIDETDLSVNTQYTRKVAAYNALGNSDLTISKSIYTLADVPTISLGEITSNTVNLSAGNTANLTSDSSGLFFDCVGENCDEGLNSWIQTSTDTATSLSANTQYTFKVRARNGDAVETLNSSNVLTYTLANVPTLTISDVETTSLTLNAGNTANITSGNSGLYFDCTGTGCDEGINEWTQSTADIVTGLNENTQYTFQVKARNGDEVETANSGGQSKYTLLNTPSIESSSVSADQIEITASTIPNKGAGSTALYFDCLSEGCDTGLNEWVDSSTEISTGLTNNSVYEYRVKGRNAESIETTYSDTATLYTLAAVPTLSVDSVTTNSIVLSASGVENLSEGSSGLYFDCTGENCDEGINNWIQITTDTATGLNVNTQYTFVSKGRSRNNIETADSNMVSAYTKANIPGTPTLVSKAIDNVKIKITANGNPSNTEYAIQEVNSGKYLNPSTKILGDTASWSTYSNWGGNNGATVNGLNAGQTYIFKVKARNGDSVETGFGETLSVTTLLTGPTMSTPQTLSSTSIQWNFVDGDSSETGFRIVDSSNTTKATCNGSNLSSCTETGLLQGVTYSRKVYSFNASSQSGYSSLVTGYTFANAPGTPTGSSTDSQSANVRIDTNDNGSSTQYLIQESQSGRYVDPDTGVLGTTASWQSYIAWGGSLGVDILDLNPNESYRFRVKAKNGNAVQTDYSSNVTIVTRANVPTNVETSDVSSTSIKITFETNGNPSSTEYVIQDENSGEFVNPITDNLVSTEVWSTYSVLGAQDGITIGGLDATEEYSFRVKARNSEGVETAYSDGTGGTVIGAKLLNVPAGLKAVLRSNENVLVSTDEGRQFGTKNVRVKAGNYILADVPVSFTVDRDWRNSVLEMNAAEYKSVIKISEDEGLADRFIMYVISGDTNAFRLCPNATSLKDIKDGCKEEVLFTGPFPQEKEVEEEMVTVSKAKLNDTTYWIVDGLSGTGGEGYTVLTEEQEEEKDTTPTVLGNFGTTLKEITKKAGEIIESTNITELNEGELQTVATTTSVITVTVGASVAAGGLSQLVYAIAQALNGVLNWFGFKRKKVKYGYVYDSYTKEPISGAVIRIYQGKGDLVATSVTDDKGAFSGDLEPGIYKIEVKKRGFDFPSKIVKGKVDLPIQNVYHGKEFLLSENDIIDIAIPLDSKKLDKKKRGQTILVSIFGNIFTILNVLLFAIGISITVYMYSKYPTTENILLSLVYIPAFCALIASFVGEGKKYGVVKDISGKRLPNIEIAVKELEFGKVIAKRVTNKKGKYRFVLPKGKYKVEILNKEYLVEEIQGGAEVNSKKEFVINRKIVVKHR